MSAFLIAPAIASATDEVNPEQQTVGEVAPGQENGAPPAAEEAQVPPTDGVVEAPAPTPAAAVTWNQMEESRRAIRDRALALRQQTIVDEIQTLPAR
jgi:hypothetical protein